MTTETISKGTEPHLKKFERFEREPKQPSWLFPLRKAGLARFAERGFPTINDEDWRFTNVSAIAKLPFEPVFDALPGVAARGDFAGIFEEAGDFTHGSPRSRQDAL